MSNQAFLSETNRNNIIKALVESDLDLTDQSNLRKSVPNTSVFDIVGAIHYCHHIDALPSKLLPLVTVHKAYGALESMLQRHFMSLSTKSFGDRLDDLRNQPKPVGVPPVLSYTGTLTATTLTVPNGTVVEEVTIPSQPTPIKEASMTTQKKTRTLTYTHVNYYELVYYIRNNKPKTVTQIAEAMGLSSSSVYRAIYTMMHFNVAKDIVNRVSWAGAEAGHEIPQKELMRIKASSIPFTIHDFEDRVAKVAKTFQPISKPVIERPTDTVDIMSMVLKAAKAGDGDAAVKLAQMADLMKKYA